MVILTPIVSREGWQTVVGNARSLAAPVQSATASIAINVTQPVGPVNKLLFGNYVIAVGRGAGILDANHQFYPEALQMIQDLQPSILRFGGQPIFEDGIGDPLSRRPMRCGWEDWHTYDYGIDEHMALLEAVGAESRAIICIGYPHALEDSADPNSCITSSVTINLSQMVKRAMAWVAYTNGDPAATTVIGVDDQGFDWQTVGYWAQQRVNNGHPEPYSVKYWEIGNIIYFYPDHISPEKYGQDYLVFQDAMKQVDPGIVVGACAMLEPYGHATWNVPLLSVIGPYVDALVLHCQYPNVVYDPSSGPAIMAGAMQADNDLAQLCQLLTTTTDRADDISLILDEVGINYDYQYEDAQPIPWNMLLVGVYDADLTGMLVERSADYRLELGTRHWLHGAAPTCDIHFDWATGERFKRPDYYALQMWTHHFGDVLVQNTLTSDTFDVSEAYGDIGPLQDIPYLAAHTSIAGDRLYLLVINRHLTDDITTAIHIKGFFPQANAPVYTLNGPSVESTNEYGRHDTVVIASSGISDAAPDFTYVFPAHSVTVIELSTTGYRVYLPMIFR